MNVIFVYAILLAFVSVVAFKDVFFGERAFDQTPFFVLGIMLVLLSVSCFFAIRRAVDRIKKLEVLITEEGLQVSNGRFKAKAAFSEIDRIIRRKDRGLVIFLRNRKVPFLLLTPRFLEFDRMEKLLAENCTVVDGKASAFVWFNRLLWIGITMITMSVFVISHHKTAVFISGIVMLGLLFFSLWQILVNRKNINILLNLIVTILLIAVILVKIIIVINMQP
ncbi:MAG: hypothetical protein FD123_4124 [Bacteroidetes bacterium]|nr:MAG: hypothetical protein FD123_4124 [Bacteroidota bacterium]